MHDHVQLLMMLAELALRAGQVPHEAASRVGRPGPAGTVRVPFRADGYAVVGMDLIVNVNGQINLCECNGSNMAATSFGAPDGDVARAEHQVAAAGPRLAALARAVVLIAYAAGTGAIAEIMARAALVCARISAERPCDLIDASVVPGAGVSVVVDSVERIAAQLSLADGRFFYQGIPVASIANPNVVPALVRRGIVGRDGPHYRCDTDVFHDGRLLDVVHDKAAQQRLAQGTGITPLAWRECGDLKSCFAAVLAFQRQGLRSVGKMNGGSGGCGIEFFDIDDDEVTVARKLARMERDARRKYEGPVERSMWPVRLFEFAQSTLYPVGDAHHLWDMRVQCLIRPGLLDLSFCGIRLCPGPFYGSLDRSSVLSNVTGRSPDLVTTRSPLVDNGRPTEHMRLGGVGEAKLGEIVVACTRWCQSAWDACEPT
jgi:hypothetical protein